MNNYPAGVTTAMIDNLSHARLKRVWRVRKHGQMLPDWFTDEGAAISKAREICGEVVHYSIKKGWIIDWSFYDRHR